MVLTRSQVLVGAAVAVGSLLVSVALAIFVITRLSEDAFLATHSPPADRRAALVRWTALVARNAAGIVLVVLGVILSVPGVPGQGVLTIIIGLLLVDLPGKHRLVRRIVRRRAVLRSLNAIRRRFGRPPFRVDPG